MTIRRLDETMGHTVVRRMVFLGSFHCVAHWRGGFQWLCIYSISTLATDGNSIVSRRERRLRAERTTHQLAIVHRQSSCKMKSVLKSQHARSHNCHSIDRLSACLLWFPSARAYWCLLESVSCAYLQCMKCNKLITIDQHSDHTGALHQSDSVWRLRQRKNNCGISIL